MNNRFLFAVLLGCALTACDKKPVATEPAPTPAGETAAERMKNDARDFAAHAAEATRNAAEKAKPALQNAGEAIKTGAQNAGEAMKEAASVAKEKIHEATAPDISPTATPAIPETPTPTPVPTPMPVAAP